MADELLPELTGIVLAYAVVRTLDCRGPLRGARSHTPPCCFLRMTRTNWMSRPSFR